jgi:muconolactone delta-isomerase
MRAAYGTSSGLLTWLKTPRTSPTSRVVALPLVRVVMIGCLMQEVAERIRAQAAAAAELATRANVLSIWTVPVERDETRVLGLHRTDSRTELDRLLAALPLYDLMQIAVAAIVPDLKRSGLSTPST